MQGSCDSINRGVGVFWCARLKSLRLNFLILSLTVTRINAVSRKSCYSTSLDLAIDPCWTQKKRNEPAPAPPLLSRTPLPGMHRLHTNHLNSEPSSAINPCFSFSALPSSLLLFCHELLTCAACLPQHYTSDRDRKRVRRLVAPISRSTLRLPPCPPPARLHHPLHQIRRHHKVRAPLSSSPSAGALPCTSPRALERRGEPGRDTGP